MLCTDRQTDTLKNISKTGNDFARFASGGVLINWLNFVCFTFKLLSCGENVLLNFNNMTEPASDNIRRFIIRTGMDYSSF